MDIQPTPVDVNKLKAILGGAKAIMNKVETGDYETGHVDARALNEDGVKEMMAEGISRPQKSVAPQITDSGQVMYKNLNTSKMPKAIKDAMLNAPIPQLTGPNHTFNLEDVADLAERPMGVPKTPVTR